MPGAEERFHDAEPQSIRRAARQSALTLHIGRGILLLQRGGVPPPHKSWSDRGWKKGKGAEDVEKLQNLVRDRLFDLLVNKWLGKIIK